MTPTHSTPAPAAAQARRRARRFVRSLPFAAAGLLVGVAISGGQGVFAGRGDAGGLPLEELRAFSEIFTKIKQDYVEDIDDKTLVENAIRGMLSGLDPHSAYLIPDDYKDLQAGTSGEFGGLGIEVGMEDGFVKVIAPIDDTPAQRAGIAAGDLIIRLDETPVKGMALSDAVKIMRGKPGTPIVLTVVREGEDGPLEITIKRDVIRVTSVRSRMLQDGFGYLRISTFQSRTGQNLREAVTKLRKENGGNLEGMVLDLRNNPGGVLNAAVAVSDAFLTDGLIVYTEGRLEQAKLKFSAKPTDVLDGAPLVVLVNGGSASASEIVAGALQDHRRAVVMGDKTFGKGSVQTILPMENGAALKLTTARYFTPKGRSIQAKGIMPDIEISGLRVSVADGGNGRRVQESDLRGSLSNPTTGVAPAPSTDESDAAAEAEAEAEAAASRPLAETDYALFEALNMLKGMSLVRPKSS